MTEYQVVLGSSSPRRQRLLREAGLELTIISPDIDETPRPDEAAVAYVERLAQGKATEAVRIAHAGGVVGETEPWLLIAADTIVAVDGELLGKPSDDAEANATLARLSGRSHQVHTGVALAWGGTDRDLDSDSAMRSSVTTTEVHFVEMTEADIDAYVATGEPADKAGSYGISGYAGRFISHLSGSYQNVVGLPLTELDLLLAEAGTSLTQLASH